MAEDDISELKVAPEVEAELAPSKRFGPTVSAWIGWMMRKAADGTWEAGVAVAGTLFSPGHWKGRLLTNRCSFNPSETLA